MNKVNLDGIKEEERRSPTGKFHAYYREISGALGSHPKTDPAPKHPFDLMLTRIPPGDVFCPYHAHSAQWELYVVLSGTGTVRDAGGVSRVSAGDHFIFGPGEAHQLSNQGTKDFVYYVIADNPGGEACYYPDSDKWSIRMPGNPTILQGKPVDYFEGEE